jgi:hypothetical protein
LGIGSAPDIEHELVRVYRLLTLAQSLRYAASLQDADGEERTPATPDPAVQYRSRLSRLPLRLSCRTLPSFTHSNVGVCPVDQRLPTLPAGPLAAPNCAVQEFLLRPVEPQVELKRDLRSYDGSEYDLEDI